MDPDQINDFNNNGRRKRSTGNVLYVFDPEPIEPTELVWSTPSRTTEEEAIQHCRKAIVNTPAYTICYNLFGDKIFEPVESCVEDIKVRELIQYSIQ